MAEYPPVFMCVMTIVAINSIMTKRYCQNSAKAVLFHQGAWADAMAEEYWRIGKNRLTHSVHF